MKHYKYTITYKGAKYHSNTMTGIARMIAKSSGETPNAVYKKLTGRSMPKRRK